MSELDLGLKAASRRLLWGLGYSTRVDVPLRALRTDAKLPTIRGAKTAQHARRPQQNAPESYTDLDVLGITVSSTSRVGSAIVDCKTGASSIISRMFWLRGLADFFDADDAYMVRDRPISKDARQLAARLGLTALSPSEVATLEGLHQQPLDLDRAPLSRLFDADYIAKVLARTTGLDRRLDGLLEYRQFDYWVYPEHRSLIEVVEALRGSRAALDGSSPINTGLVLDFAWLYALSIAQCLAHLRTVHVSDLSYGLSEYLAGGPMQLKQLRDTAELLDGLKGGGFIPKTAKVNVNPPFFGPLLELLVRFLRRTETATTVLRILEYQSTAALAGDKVPAELAFGDQFDRVAAKLAADVVDFIVAAADLDPKFSSTARELLLNLPAKEVTTGVTTSSSSSTDSMDQSSDSSSLELNYPEVVDAANQELESSPEQTVGPIRVDRPASSEDQP